MNAAPTKPVPPVTKCDFRVTRAGSAYCEPLSPTEFPATYAPSRGLARKRNIEQATRVADR